MNGTSLTTFNVDVNSLPSTHVFYQDYESQIRRLQKIGSLWSGGPAFPAVVTSNVKNATPLACANYTDPKTNANVVSLSVLPLTNTVLPKASQAHVFYVDSSSVLQEVISKDNLSTWQNGPLGSSSIKTSSSSTALAAMYSQRWFGATNGSSPGLRLYYGSTDNQVHELAFALSDTSWSTQFQFNGSNGNAGTSVSSVDNTTGVARLYMLDMSNNIMSWWLDASIKANGASALYGNWSEGILFRDICYLSENV